MWNFRSKWQHRVIIHNMEILLVLRNRACKSERLRLLVQVFLKKRSTFPAFFRWGFEAPLHPGAGAGGGAKYRNPQGTQPALLSAPQRRPRVLVWRPAHVQWNNPAQGINQCSTDGGRRPGDSRQEDTTDLSITPSLRICYSSFLYSSLPPKYSQIVLCPCYIIFNRDLPPPPRFKSVF